MASNPNIKAEAQRLIEQLADSSSWDDLMHQIYVRQTVEAGLVDVEANRVLRLEEVRQKLGLPR